MAYLERSGILVISQTYHFDFHKYISHIIDPETGKSLAIVKRGRTPFGQKASGINTGGLRTGAAAAIGAKYLAKENVDAVGVVGTGRIGRASLLCTSKVRDFDAIYAHSGRKRDEEFAQTMSKMIGVDVIPTDTVKEIAEKSQLILTSTYAQQPVLLGEWLSEGTHISGMGADGPLKAEIGPRAFQRASKIYIDGIKCLSIGEIARPLAEGLITDNDITGRIGELVAGNKPGRVSDEEITIFESDGTHMQSAAVVGLIYRRVMEAGLGQDIYETSDFYLNS
jgi:alanine dehydrogenase